MSKIIRKIKLQIPLKKAKVSSSIGPMLGQYSLNSKKFCDDFNKSTENFGDLNLIVKVLVYVKESNNYSFEIFTPPTSILLKIYSEKNFIKFSLIEYIACILLLFDKNLKFLTTCKNLISTAKSMKMKVQFD